MSCLIYLDFLRRVTPNPHDNKCKLDFMLFGSFDALRVKLNAKHIIDVKKMHEEGHEAIQSFYDRQPMFLHEADDTVGESAHNIFSTTEPYADLPIVISIIQTNKQAYAASSNPSTEDLKKQFSNLITQSIASLSEEQKAGIGYWSVFWNLGESDIVIVFRPKQLYSAALVLHKIRVNQSNIVPVLSSCSHCGFPYLENEEKTKEALIDWLTREDTSQAVRFISFINTSSAYHRLDDFDGRFLFGEWDYIFKHKPEDTAECLAEYIFRAAYPPSDAEYKTSYTLPAIKLDNLGHIKTDPLSDPENWADSIQSSFQKLINYLNSIPSKPVTEDSVGLIESIRHTFVGLAKYLIRLYLGRYEQDLYCYTKPVFVALPKIVDNYTEQITAIQEKPYWDDRQKGIEICDLVMELEDDSTKLISSLQHLFAVLSVSPHTFIETFGSNMRSLSAANKLVDAYQGLIAFLSDHFPDQIDPQTHGDHNIIIIPYRKSYPTHTLFYPSASPCLRISKIEMDFPKMFNIGPSVFIILHECAHHLGDRLRSERWTYYYKVCVYYAVESLFKDFLFQPLNALISTAEKKSLNDAVSSPLFMGLKSGKAALIRDYNLKVYSSAKKAIRDLSEQFISLLSDIKDMVMKSGSPESSIQQVYSEQLYSIYISKVVKQVFETAFPEGTYSIADDLREKLLIAIQSFFVDEMAIVARELTDEIITLHGNQSEASRFLAKYLSGNMAADILKFLPNNIHRDFSKGSIDLLDVFSDVYADIFAIEILQVSCFRKYCELILPFTGTAVNRAVVSKKNLLRLVVIGKAYFNLDVIENAEGLDDLISANQIPVWRQKDIIINWGRVATTSYFGFVCKYAEECKNAISQMRDKCLACSNDEITKLQSVFKSNEMDTEIEFIESFWKYLLRRKV